MSNNIDIYIAVGIIGVLVVLLIAQCIKNDRYDYINSDRIMIKTGNGIIKTNDLALAEKIHKIIITLSKKQYENIDHLIAPAIEHLDEFININPISGNAQLFELKSQIIYEITEDDNTSGIMSDVNTVLKPYDNFIKKLKIVHKMLINKLCNGGLLDYRSIAYIATHCNRITPTQYENDVGNVKLPKHNISSHATLSLFASKQSQPDDQTIERRPKISKIHKQPKRVRPIERS